jgi:hypothetical protein
VGRFVSPERPPGEREGYLYAGSGPTVAVDPGGLQAYAAVAPGYCFYHEYQRNATKRHYCPLKACQEANRVCGSHVICGACGPGPDPRAGGPRGVECSPRHIRRFADFLVGGKGPSCGGLGVGDKLGHCWAACVATACSGQWGDLPWRCLVPRDPDPRDVAAEEKGMECGLLINVRESVHIGQDCLGCCAGATRDMPCW